MLAMSFKRILPGIALVAWLPCAFAADAETRAFNAAAKASQDGFHAFAEKAFANFVAQHPASPRIPTALLAQARAALAQKKFQPASDVLATNMLRAGALADQFQYWLGQVQFDSGKFDAAARTFAGLAAAHTNSAMRLDAVVAEAEARFKLRQWPKVAALLQSGGAFHSLAEARDAADPLPARGRLLLAEALFQQKDYAGAEQVLARIGNAAPSPQLRWHREFLMCQVQFASQRPEAALEGTTNLVTFAAATTKPELMASSVALQGDLLEALNRPDAAVKAFEINLSEGVPAERQREAFFKTVQLTLAQGRLADGAARLETFLLTHTNEAGSDVAVLSLGELRLRQHQLGTNAMTMTNAPAGTNLLELALADFSRVLREFPKSPFVAQAQLGRGWALLAQGKTAESAGAFEAAAEGLADSEAQAVARFKLADLQFASGDVTNAVRNYRRVIIDYAAFKRVQRELVGRALYQMLQAGIALRDVAAAGEAMERILQESAQTGYAERGLLLFGQALNELSSAAAARKVFAEFSDRFPTSALLPEVSLALGRAYEREQNWAAAIGEYEQWRARFPSNENLARAEFALALALYHAGQETNALGMFTNFVARFSSSPLAARAQNWIGDYFFTRGVVNSRDDRSDDYFREAEKNYQLLFTERTISTNWAVSELTFAAQLKAGRAAFRRQNPEQAVAYFTNLINAGQNDTRCPPALVVEAVFAYGDTYADRMGTNALERFSRALGILGFIPQHYPNDPLVPRAWGRMGDFQLQLASADPAAYAAAYENYRKVTNSPLADIVTRSQAEVGMGHVKRGQAAAAPAAEAAALLDEATGHYLNVVYGLNLRGDEQADSLWVRDAALAAAKIAEGQGQWQRAIDLYRRVGEMIPALKEGMEKKAAPAREKRSLQKS